MAIKTRNIAFNDPHKVQSYQFGLGNLSGVINQPALAAMLATGDCVLVSAQINVGTASGTNPTISIVVKDVPSNTTLLSVPATALNTAANTPTFIVQNVVSTLPVGFPLPDSQLGLQPIIKQAEKLTIDVQLGGTSPAANNVVILLSVQGVR